MTIVYWKISLASALLVGCAPSTDRQALQVSVTLDGMPLQKGVIQVIPLPGTYGPSVGGEFQKGRFTLREDSGALPGTYRVEITATQKTGRTFAGRFTGEKVDELRNILPPRYNKNSELTMEVTRNGLNTFEFELTSNK